MDTWLLLLILNRGLALSTANNLDFVSDSDILFYFCGLGSSSDEAMADATSAVSSLIEDWKNFYLLTLSCANFLAAML